VERPQRILVEQIKSLEGQGLFGVDIARELYVQGYLLHSARRALRACGYFVLDSRLADIEGIFVSEAPFFHVAIMDLEAVYWASTTKIVRATECEETYN